MPSPFPGVDPYLEAQGLWADFHSEFISAWRSALLDKLPAEYDARVGEHVYIVQDHDEPGRLIIPDVAIEQLPDAADSGGTAVAVQAGIGTHVVTLPIPYEVRESYIEIRKHPERTLVAVLELLSPTNTGPERASYLKKRDELLVASVHLVELDLLMLGQRLPITGHLPPANYYAFVARGDARPHCCLHCWGVRNLLPTIGIPLAEPGHEMPSDLGEVFRTAWQRGRYERAIDYSRPLQLPLHEQDLTWARELIRQGGTSPQAATGADNPRET